MTLLFKGSSSYPKLINSALYPEVPWQTFPTGGKFCCLLCLIQKHQNKLWQNQWSQSNVEELWRTLQLPSFPKMMDFCFVHQLWITKLFSPREEPSFWCEGMQGWHTGFQTLLEMPLAPNETSWYRCTTRGSTGTDLGLLLEVSSLTRLRKEDVMAHLLGKQAAPLMITVLIQKCTY